MGADLTTQAAAAQTLSAHLTRLADGMDEAAAALPGPTSGWTGPAATAAAHLLATRPERFRAVAAACRGAATALIRHSETLGPAVQLGRQSEQAPIDLVPVLERRAAEVVGESARRTAGTVATLADSAPTRRSGWRGRLQQVDTWRAEVALGAAEATESLTVTAIKVMGKVINPFRRSSLEEIHRAGTAVVESARHPRELGQAVLDWETWRDNPARAVGHLVPDAAAAAVTGGTAAGVRATATAGQRRTAARFAATRDHLRRESGGATAAAARTALIHRAEAEAQARIQAAGLRITAPTWSGEGGARLTALQNAGVEVYHSLSTAQERSLTAIMREVSTLGRGELNGLDHRLKTPESSKRKVAREHARTGGPLPLLLAETEDTVRYSVVLQDQSYVRGVSEIARSLEQRGFHAREPHNAWHGPRYRGINSVWLDPTTGAAFEVQFHTPASYRITQRTHTMYEEFRLPDTPTQRRVELHQLIATEYRKAPIPGWVEVLKGNNFPLPSTPEPITAPISSTGAAAVTAATATHLTATEPRP